MDSLLVVEGDVGKLLPPRPVHGVGESRMIGGELAPVGEDLAGDFKLSETATVLNYLHSYLIGVAVQIPDVLREPRDAVRVVLVLPAVAKWGNDSTDFGCMDYINVNFVMKFNKNTLFI